MNKLEIPTTNYLSSYDVCYQHVNTACESHKNLWDLIKICQKHIAGEKPNDPKKLRDKGMAWVSNYNYNKARSKIEKGTAENIAKISSSIALGYSTFRRFKKSDKEDDVLNFLENEEKRGIVAAALGQAFSTMLSGESRVSGWLNEIEYPAYAFGYCAVVYDKHDWLPDAVHPIKIAFEPKTKPENITSFVVFKTISAKDLYNRWISCYNEEIVENEDSEGKKVKIASSGWNLQALEAILLKVFKGVNKDRRPYEQWSEVVPVFRSNPSMVISMTNDLNIAKIFYKELDNTLTEAYIPWDNQWQTKNNNKDQTVDISDYASQLHVGERLFCKNHGKYDQGTVIGLIRDSGFSETGYIQDYRGIAKYAVEDSFRYNQRRNSTNDKLMFIGSPIIESNSTITADKIKITMGAGYLVMPPNTPFLEKNFNFDISPHINMLQFEEREYLRDTQQFDATIQGRLSSRPNKGEVEQVTQEIGITGNSKNNIKLKDYSSIFFNIVKRIPIVECEKSDPGYNGKKSFYELVKSALPWLVESDGDVDKIIKAIDSYVIEPVTSNKETITIAIQMAETPFARNRLKRMFLIASGFPIEEVNITVPLTSDKFKGVEDERLASIENDLFFISNDKLTYGTDDHIVHTESHMNKCAKVIEGFKNQSIKPSDAYAYLSNNSAHTQMHIDMLGQDPILNKKAQEYQSSLNEIIKSAKMIGQQAQAISDQEANQQPSMSPDTQEKLRQDDVKLQSDIRRKDILAQHRTEQAYKKMDLSHQQQMERIRLDNEAKLSKIP